MEKNLVCSHYLKLQCHSVMAKNARLHRGKENITKGINEGFCHPPKNPTKPLEDEVKEINHGVPGILLLVSFPCWTAILCVLLSLIEPHQKSFRATT